MGLLIATRNRGKMAEFEQLLAEIPLDLVSLEDLKIEAKIPETGTTFDENARIKATGCALLSGMPAMADDSGLAIDYLGGAPGVRSARYAGEAASDTDRIEKVLYEMRGVPADGRKAQFICVAAFADSKGKIVCTTDGRCAGSITDMPRGDGGFGYDPIFLPDGFDKTFGELPSDVKNELSHRARAVAKIIPFLRGFFNI